LATSEAPPLNLGRSIGALDRHGVKYLLCGGAAATAYGAQRRTEDADCVVGRERANLDRLGEAMWELNARLRVAGMTDEEAKLLPALIDGATLAVLSITATIGRKASAVANIAHSHISHLKTWNTHQRRPRRHRARRFGTLSERL
jgi:hypothetical protein